MANLDFNDPSNIPGTASNPSPAGGDGFTIVAGGPSKAAPASQPAPAPATSVTPQPGPAPTASPAPSASQPTPPPAAPVAPSMPPPDNTAPDDAFLNNPWQKQIAAWKQGGASDDEINQNLTRIFQPQVDDWKAKGASDDEINRTIGTMLGYNPSSLPQLQQGISENVSADPPKPANTVQEFADQILKYGAIAELIHGAPPAPEVQPAETDIPGQIAQMGGQAVAQIPGATVFGAGSSILTGSPTPGVLLYNFLDAFVRFTYADASAKGQTTRPDFADNATQHATDALKDTALFAPALLVGGPAGKLGEQMALKYGAGWLAKATAKWGSRGFAELAAMTIAQDTIAGKLEPWQTTLANATVLAGMHIASAGGAKIASLGGDTKPVDNGKLDQMTPSDAAKALLQHTAVTAEPSDAVIQRVGTGTTLPALQAKADAIGIKSDPTAIQKAWSDAKALNQGPAIRARFYNSLVTDGPEKANEYLKASGGNPDRFSELWLAGHAKDFGINPAKYGGNLQTFHTRFDPEPPPSPEMVKAANARVSDKAGKTVPYVMNVPASRPIMGDILRSPVQTMRKVFNPTSLDAAARDAGALIRANTGVAARATAETEASIKAAKARKAMAAVPDVLPILDHIEGRRGDTGVAPASFGDTQKAADTLHDIVQTRRDALAALPGGAPGAEEFYPNLWTDKAAAKAFVAKKLGKVGTGVWPTVGEGIRAGLEPKTDPVSAVQQYAAHMDQAIAIAGIRDVATDAGYWAYHPKGKQPAGWVELNGPLSQRPHPPAGVHQAYAPESWARVYNNYVSKGFGEFGDWADVYDGVQHTSNAISALKLALSYYHAMVITKAAISNGVAQGIDELTSGHPIMALKSFGTAPFKPITSLVYGRDAQKIYTGQRTGTDQDQRIVDLVTEAGGRMDRGRQAAIDYTYSKLGSYVTSALQGTLGSELRAQGREIAAAPISGSVKVVASNIGRVMQTVGQPLFEKYIPWVKNAATYNHVASWLQRNPGASHADAVAATRYIVDRMDDRFGEMVHDNIFVNKFAKQLGSAMLLSWSWTVGEDIRSIGGGAADTLKFLGNTTTLRAPTWTPKMSYIVASAITTAVIGSTIQYMLTGKWPDNPIDAFAPKTGGKDANGDPERLQIPGPEKDIWETLANGIPGEIGNKFSPAFKSAYELWNNKDWKGDPIAAWNVPGETGLPGTGYGNILGEYAQYIFNNWGMPIVATQNSPTPGSKINPIESFLGFRQPTPLLRNPEKFNEQQSYFATQAWLRKLRSDARANAKEQP